MSALSVEVVWLSGCKSFKVMTDEPKQPACGVLGKFFLPFDIFILSQRQTI